MTHITLPSPDGEFFLTPTLQLVEKLEKETSLLKTAEKLLARELKLCEMLPLLRICYNDAGCRMEPAALDAYLLETSPGLLLTEILVAILSPLSSMGALKPGEQLAARTARISDF